MVQLLRYEIDSSDINNRDSVIMTEDGDAIKVITQERRFLDFDYVVDRDDISVCVD